MRKPPARLQRTSIRPNPSIARATASAAADRSRRSGARIIRSGPSGPNVQCRRSTCRSRRTSRAPVAAKAAPTARPRFPPAPVTRTTRRAFSFMTTSRSARRRDGDPCHGDVPDPWSECDRRLLGRWQPYHSRNSPAHAVGCAHLIPQVRRFAGNPRLTMNDPLLIEQAAYYRARAPEYDDWWQRTGRFDRGPEATGRWRAEVAQVEADLLRAGLTGDVLELACGTGWWTERLARTAARLTCIDGSPETIDINRRRLSAAGLALPRYEVADLFEWTPSASFDAVFFSFWLSHVPADRFDWFWAMVA